jgi:hypothetical protein
LENQACRKIADRIRMLNDTSMIPKSGHRFSDKIMLKRNEHDPEKWAPVFGQDHAQAKRA